MKTSSLVGAGTVFALAIGYGVFPMLAETVDLPADDSARAATHPVDVTDAADTATDRDGASSSVANAVNLVPDSRITDIVVPPMVVGCGNGVREEGEQCDDGGESATCDSDCTVAMCGDGTVNETAGEECDDGGTAPGDGCDENCQSEPAALVLALTPVGATGPHSIFGNVVLLRGGGRTVFLEVQMHDMHPGLVKTWQVRIDGQTGYASGLGDPLTHAVELCSDDAHCEGTFGPGSTCRSMCLGGAREWLDCDSDADCPDGTCEAMCDFAFQSIARPDFVLPPEFNPICAVDVSTVPLMLRFGSTTTTGLCMEDGGEVYYGGTLALYVPSDAAGTYEIGFDVDSNQTFVTDCDYTPIPVAEYVSALIIVGDVQ